MTTIKNIPEESAISIWNNFVQNQAHLTPYSFNPSLYYFFKKHFNWKPYYILVFKNDEVCAVLSLVNTGKAWVSLPHFSYGGVLFTERIKSFSTNGIINILISDIDTNQRLPGFYKYELENNQIEKKLESHKYFIRTFDNSEDNNFKKSEKLTSILELPESKDKLSEILNSNLNRKIKKAIKSGFTIKNGGKELLDEYYNVYSQNIYELKSLSYSKQFFSDLFETYEFGNLKIFVAYMNDQVVGSSMMASYNGFNENMFFAVKSEYRKHYISDYLHWEMINHCITQQQPTSNQQLAPSNPHIYSFGRSTENSGVHIYKSHWPVKDYPLYYYTNMTDLRKNNFLSNIWAILPSFISKPLGAKLIKHLY